MYDDDAKDYPGWLTVVLETNNVLLIIIMNKFIKRVYWYAPFYT